MRGGPLAGYFQPVEIKTPLGTQISPAVSGQFITPSPAPLKAAMLVGNVYRLRLTSIPKHEGEELYPTIEIINRLYPPIGEELRFPVPIELTQQDLDSALAGKFITRIVYVENPRQAYPHSEDPNFQETFDVSPKEDPLAVADRVGRPMVIVRIGGRTPEDTANPDSGFLYNSPPLLLPLALIEKAGVVSSNKSAAAPGGRCLAYASLPSNAYTGDPSDGYTTPGAVPPFMQNAVPVQGAACGEQSPQPPYPVDQTPMPMNNHGPWRPPGIACPWPDDEYIFDGGDNDGGVKVLGEGQYRGVDPEDTVAHYQTLEGHTVVKPTNRVCIYAPRFAAVRQVILAFNDNQNLRAGGVLAPIKLVRQDEVLPVEHHHAAFASRCRNRQGCAGHVPRKAAARRRRCPGQSHGGARSPQALRRFQHHSLRHHARKRAGPRAPLRASSHRLDRRYRRAGAY